MSAVPLLLSTSVESDGSSDAVIIHVRGELDRNTSPILYQQLIRLLMSGRRELLLDVTRVTFLDLGGHRMLEEIARRCIIAKGGIVLRNPGFAVRRLLDMVGLPVGVVVVAPSEQSLGTP